MAKDFDQQIDFVRNTTMVNKISFVGHNTGANPALQALSLAQNYKKEWYYTKLDSVLVIQPCFYMEVSSLIPTNTFARDDYSLAMKPFFDNYVTAIGDQLWTDKNQKLMCYQGAEKTTACKYITSLHWQQAVSVRHFDNLMQNAFSQKFARPISQQDFASGKIGTEFKLSNITSFQTGDLSKSPQELQNLMPISVIYSDNDAMCPYVLQRDTLSTMSLYASDGHNIDVDQNGLLTWLGSDAYFSRLNRYIYKFPMMQASATFDGNKIPGLARGILAGASCLALLAVAF